MSDTYISIIIPNFNGVHLLNKNLPGLIQETKKINKPCEIIIVDDASTDESLSFIGKQFPDVRVISNDENIGFGETVNKGVFASHGKIIVIINNDVCINERFFEPLLKHFDNEDIFSVVPAIIFKDQYKDNSPKNEAINTCEFWYGLFGIKRLGLAVGGQDKKEILYPPGTIAAYNRSKLLVLEGFDDIYAPFYWEDVDLGYRAWKKGWRTVYEPQSRAYHEGKASIGKFYTDNFIHTIEQRNAIIFLWNNIDDWKFLFEHILFLPVRLLRALFMWDIIFLRGFWQALLMLKKVFARRMRRKKKTQGIFTDRQIISRLGNSKIRL